MNADALGGNEADRLARARLVRFYEGHGVPRAPEPSARVAVVGAGIAGLVAAHVLRAGGLEPAVFEASDRIGGRIQTEIDGAGKVWELGGEFIDTQHHDILALADRFALPLLDTASSQEAELSDTLCFEGQYHSDDEVAAAWRRLAPTIARDVAALGARASRRRHARRPDPVVVRFDRLPLSDYLAGLETERWMKKLIEVAYVAVYGCEAAQQSTINLLSLIGTSADRFDEFGTSDERWKLLQGSASLTDALAAGCRDRIWTGHALTRLRRTRNGYRLTLDRSSGAVDVDADAVILAIPFSTLRRVDLSGTVTPAKQRCIDQLQYGSNAKLLVSTRAAPWRARGSSGSSYSDHPFQSTWDSSRGRSDGPSVFTYYCGGAEGLRISRGEPQAHARRYAAATESFYPGFAAAHDHDVRGTAWPTDPWSLGSYTCYAPGQFTTIAGDEFTPCGRVHFAGEHTATGSQGYMNGAAETGRRAATQVLRTLARR